MNSITVSLHFSKSKANKSDMTTWEKKKKHLVKRRCKRVGGKKSNNEKKNGTTDVDVVKSLAEAETRRQKPENRFSASSLFFSL